MVTELIRVRKTGVPVPISIEIGEPYKTTNGLWRTPITMHGLDGRLPDICCEDLLESQFSALEMINRRLVSIIDSGDRLTDSEGAKFPIETYFPKTGGPKTKVSNTNDLLINFFHEVISRVVPGLVLALYAYKPIIAAFDKFHHSSIIFGLSILSVAWLIGVTLDIVVIIYLALYKLFTGKHLHQVSEPSGDETKCLRFRKDQAERVMYRSIFLISIISLIALSWKPELFSDVTPILFSEDQPKLIGIRLIGIIVCVLFLWAFLWDKFKDSLEDKAREFLVKLGIFVMILTFAFAYGLFWVTERVIGLSSR
jgi:hypothetical protein